MMNGVPEAEIRRWSVAQAVGKCVQDGMYFCFMLTRNR